MVLLWKSITDITHTGIVKLIVQQHNIIIFYNVCSCNDTNPRAHYYMYYFHDANKLILLTH